MKARIKRAQPPKEEPKEEVGLTRAMVDAFVPEHTVLRYHEKVICTDTNRLGGLDYDFENKEWRCKRCVLLDLLEPEYLRPSWAEEAEVVLQVHNIGNVV